jgi:hypothetical protein
MRQGGPPTLNSRGYSLGASSSWLTRAGGNSMLRISHKLLRPAETAAEHGRRTAELPPRTREPQRRINGQQHCPVSLIFSK